GAVGGLEFDLDIAFPFHPGLDVDRGIGALDGGGDLHAAAAQIAQGDVVAGDHDEAYIPVDAAVEGEVGLLGIDGIVAAVVHRHGEGVVFCQDAGDVGPEGGVAAVMVQDLLPVD